MGKKNIFVLGQDKTNEAKLKQISNREQYEFHPVLDYDYIHSFKINPMSKIMNDARTILRNFPGKIDGMICLWDFPGCLMYPILCQELGLKAPSVESVFKCENKFLSRLQQAKSIPECVPKFWGFNPDESNIIERAEVDYPFWVKPVTAYSGHLGFKVNSDKDFEDALAKIESRKKLFARPYWYLEKQMHLSGEMERASEKIFLAEQIIGGKQCTLEGFVFKKKIGFHGIIDSFRFPNRMSFCRYQYPSKLPRKIKQLIYEKAEKIMKQVGYDNGSFNIEFFWDKRENKLWLLEINTRISQSHCELFRLVDGESSHKLIVDIVDGREPSLPHRQGPYNIAGKLFLRDFENGTVTKVPGAEKIEAVKRQYDAEIYITVHEGMKLDELKWQDSYSYVLLMAYMGAKDQKQLLSKFDDCANSLGIEIDGKKIVSKQGRKSENNQEISV